MFMKFFLALVGIAGIFSSSVFAADLNDFLGCYGDQGCNIKVSIKAEMIFDSNYRPIPSLYFSTLRPAPGVDCRGWNFGSTPVAIENPSNISTSTDGNKLVAKTFNEYFDSNGLSTYNSGFGGQDPHRQIMKITKSNENSFEFFTQGRNNTGLTVSGLQKIECPAN